MAIDIVALEYALAVLEAGSLRQAASALGVQASAVSRRVRALEDMLGVGLFQRSTAGVSPTVAGRRLLGRAAAILADLRELERMARSQGSGEEGRLCVGVVSTIAGGTARELLQMFVSRHPRVELQIVEGRSRDHVADIRALRMDAALLVDPRQPTGCEVEPLWSEAVVIALAADHPLANFDVAQWSQLAGDRFIVSQADPGPDIHDWLIRRLAQRGDRADVEMRPVHRDALLAMVGLGQGLTIFGAAETAITYPNVSYRTLDGELLPYSGVWSASNDNPALRRFLSLARLHVRALRRQQAEHLRPSAVELSRTPDPSP